MGTYSSSSCPPPSVQAVHFFSLCSRALCMLSVLVSSFSSCIRIFLPPCLMGTYSSSSCPPPSVQAVHFFCIFLMHFWITAISSSSCFCIFFLSSSSCFLKLSK